MILQKARRLWTRKMLCWPASLKRIYCFFRTDNKSQCSAAGRLLHKVAGEQTNLISQHIDKTNGHSDSVAIELIKTTVASIPEHKSSKVFEAENRKISKLDALANPLCKSSHLACFWMWIPLINLFSCTWSSGY